MSNQSKQREIKFRAWSADTKEMIPWEECMFPEWLEDSDITMMQYSGIKDKDGVGIYEGDVAKDRLTNAIFEVRFGYCKKYSFHGWFLYAPCLGIYRPLTHDNTLEILGDIFTTPELLK